VTFVLEANDESAGDEHSAVEQYNTPALELAGDEHGALEQYTPAPEPVSPSRSGWTQDFHSENTYQAQARSPVYENRPSQDTTNSPLNPLSDNVSALTLREASLMRHFIQKIAPWVSFKRVPC
jgi:hypothetical protein